MQLSTMRTITQQLQNVESLFLKPKKKLLNFYTLFLYYTIKRLLKHIYNNHIYRMVFFLDQVLSVIVYEELCLRGGREWQGKQITKEKKKLIATSSRN